MQLGLIKILDDSGRLPAYLFLRRLGGAEKMGGIRRLGDVLPWLCFRTVGGEMIVPDSKLGSGFIPAGTMTRGSGRQMMIKRVRTTKSQVLIRPNNRQQPVDCH